MAESKNPKVGELLTRAGVLRKQDLQEAISIAQDTGQMIGKVLIMSGFITKEDLAAAVEAQSLIRDDVLEPELAILGLSTSSREHILLEQALDQLGWHPQNKPTAKLGELLIASGNISIEHLTKSPRRDARVCAPTRFIVGRMACDLARHFAGCLECPDRYSRR